MIGFFAIGGGAGLAGALLLSDGGQRPCTLLDFGAATENI